MTNLTRAPLDRRAFILGTAAAATAAAATVAAAAKLPALPALAATKVDRALFTSRLNEWALSVPEMADRIDAMLSDVDHVLSTHEGTETLFEASAVCAEKGGRQVSFDWLTGIDTYPSGAACRMFIGEPERSEEETKAALSSALQKLDDRRAHWIYIAMLTLRDGDYAAARYVQSAAHADLGIVVEQW